MSVLTKDASRLEVVREMFLARLKVPHAGTHRLIEELEDTFGAYSSFESRFGDERYTERMKSVTVIVTKTRIANIKRESLEIALNSADHKMESYLSYVDALKRDHYKRKEGMIIKEIKCLYWRTTRLFFYNPQIWVSFLAFLTAGNETDLKYLEFIASRAIKNSGSCSVCADLWGYYMIARDRNGDGVDDIYKDAAQLMISLKNYEQMDLISVLRLSLARMSSSNPILNLY